MNGLDQLWPDPDRRDDALYRVAAAIVARHEPRTRLNPSELRALQAVSVGLDRNGVAAVHNLSPYTVAEQLQAARRALRAKNTTHAVAEALRQGLIR